MTDTDALTERIRDEVYGTWISSCCDGAVINIDEAAEIAADLIPIVAAEVRKAKAEALRAWASGVKSQLDATADKGIDLGEWGRGLRSGVQQARDTADRIETGDQ